MPKVEVEPQDINALLIIADEYKKIVEYQLQKVTKESIREKYLSVILFVDMMNTKYGKNEVSNSDVSEGTEVPG